MQDTPRVFVPPPLIIFGALAIALLLDGRSPSWSELLLVPALIGGAITLIGVTLIALALKLFHKASTRPEPWKPSSTLVCDGVYRFTRNPMYLGMLVTYCGVSLALRSFIAFGLLLPVFVIILCVRAFKRFGVGFRVDILSL